jgi:hypothetical protein
LNRVQLVLLLLLGLVAGLLLLVVMQNRQPPLLPDDPDHVTFYGHTTCLVCHGPAGPHPQSRNHPVGNDCMRCHGLP